jgi:LysM repeat protein
MNAPAQRSLGRRRAPTALVVAALPVAAVLVGALAIGLPSGAAFAGTVTVRPGQTLSQVAAEEGTTVAALAAANGITDANDIAAGAVLQLPAPSVPAAPGAPAAPAPAAAPATITVTIRPGETLSALATQYATTVAAIAAANGIGNPNDIAAGTAVHVPAPGAPAAPPAPAAAAGPATITVTIRPGETLSALATQYATTVAALAAANGIGNPNDIAAGTVVQVPTPRVSTASAGSPGTSFSTVEVQPGETLSALAARYGTTTAVLASANGIADPNRVEAGTVLVLPSGPSNPAPVGSAAPVMTVGTVTVRAGATLTSLAAQYGTTPDALAAANGITNPNMVFPGERLTLPAGLAVAGAPGVAVPAGTGDYPTPLLGFPSRLALQPDFVHSATASGVPVALLEALCWWESGWQTTAVSAEGAIGVCQIEPTTAAFVSSSILQEPLDPLTAADNIALCAAYLRYLLNSTGGNASQALADYDQGPASIAQQGVLGSTQAYVKGILAYASIFAGQG